MSSGLVSRGVSQFWWSISLCGVRVVCAWLISIEFVDVTYAAAIAEVESRMPEGSRGDIASCELRERCSLPGCPFLVHSDLNFCPNYCCLKCQGLHQGADWAKGGRRHYKHCECIYIYVYIHLKLSQQKHNECQFEEFKYLSVVLFG